MVGPGVPTNSAGPGAVGVPTIGRLAGMERKRPGKPQFSWPIGSQGGIRTPDQAVNSRLLYR